MEGHELLEAGLREEWQAQQGLDAISREGVLREMRAIAEGDANIRKTLADPFLSGLCVYEVMEAKRHKLEHQLAEANRKKLEAGHQIASAGFRKLVGSQPVASC
jgi:hypothetical protein